MTDRRFRIILIAYIVSLLAAIIANFVPGGYSAGLSAAYKAEPYWLADASLTVLVAVLLLTIVAMTVGIVGLYFFKPWARSLSFLLTVAGTPVAAFAGPTLVSGLESTLWEISTLLWGAILALAYYSPVADGFRANSSFKPTPHRGSN